MERNDRSLVLQFRYGKHELLLTGDVEEEGELRLAQALDPAAGGVLKVVHHGSRTSSHEPLLKKIQTALSLISAGYDNLYRHPHSSVLARLAGAGSQVLRNDQEGLIQVFSDGRRYEVRTYRLDRATSCCKGTRTAAELRHQ